MALCVVSSKGMGHPTTKICYSGDRLKLFKLQTLRCIWYHINGFLNCYYYFFCLITGMALEGVSPSYRQRPQVDEAKFRGYSNHREIKLSALAFVSIYRSVVNSCMPTDRTWLLSLGNGSLLFSYLLNACGHNWCLKHRCVKAEYFNHGLIYL